MKLFKDIMKCVLVLGIIACLSGALLGIFNSITYVSAEERLNRQLKKLFDANSFEIVYEANNDIEGKVIKATEENGEEYYIAYSLGQGGFGGAVPIYVVINDKTIGSVSCGSNAETISTPFKEPYLSKFVGVNIDEINAFVGVNQPSSNKGEIDTVSNATMSSNAIINGVNGAVSAYKEFLGEGA